jgi:hypothetical protein
LAALQTLNITGPSFKRTQTTPKTEPHILNNFPYTKAEDLTFLSLRLDYIPTILLDEKYVLAIFEKLLRQSRIYPELLREYEFACKKVKDRCNQIEKFCIERSEDYRVGFLVSSGIRLEKIVGLGLEEIIEVRGQIAGNYQGGFGLRDFPTESFVIKGFVLDDSGEGAGNS